MQHSPSHFDYNLPEDRIAQHPADQRDQAKLLVYDRGQISDHPFGDVTSYLPDSHQLVMNDTRVIHARVFLYKPTGGRVELFLLRPDGVSVEEAMLQAGKARWWCLIGGAKKWKEGKVTTESDELYLEAEVLDRSDDKFLVELNWKPAAMQFTELIEHLGKIPLPPYMNRDADAEDTIRYQTTYATQPGSVAAPTAGLHFTDAILNAVKADQVKLTLHVSAGTFKPISADDYREHEMHDEECVVTTAAIRSLAKRKTRFAIGTTSLRTLESLFWFAAKWKLQKTRPESIEQFDAEQMESPFAHFEAAMEWLSEQLAGEERLSFRTSIMISPGYRIWSIDGLFTNFHMPKSTLILLVCALIGEDWRKVYEYALANDYRFLSYGDSSLLIPTNLRPGSLQEH